MDDCKSGAEWYLNQEWADRQSFSGRNFSEFVNHLKEKHPDVPADKLPVKLVLPWKLHVVGGGSHTLKKANNGKKRGDEKNRQPGRGLSVVFHRWMLTPRKIEPLSYGMERVDYGTRRDSRYGASRRGYEAVKKSTL